MFFRFSANKEEQHKFGCCCPVMFFQPTEKSNTFGCWCPVMFFNLSANKEEQHKFDCWCPVVFFQPTKKSNINLIVGALLCSFSQQRRAT